MDFQANIRLGVFENKTTLVLLISNLTSHLLIVYNGLVYFFFSVKTIFEKALSIYITVSVDVCNLEPQYDLFLFLSMIYFYFCRKVTFKNKNSHKTVSIVINTSGHMSQKRGNKISVLLVNLWCAPNQITACKWISFYFQYKLIKRKLKSPGNTNKRKKECCPLRLSFDPFIPVPAHCGFS